MNVVQQKQARDKTSPRPNGSRGISFLHSSRLLLFGLALLLFGLFTFVAHRQAPRPDPFQPVQSFTKLDWWQYPLERNAFKRLPVITSNLNDAFALPNSEKVWAVGSDGMIVHSEDGGEIWVKQEVNWEAIADNQVTQTSLMPEQQIDPKQASNANEAANMARKQAPSKMEQKGLDLAQNQANAPARTPITRAVVPVRTPPALQSVYFVDANHGWAVGDDGTILVTSNGGTTWQAPTSGTRSGLRSVHFVNATTGWAVGIYGTILVTSNGGANWQAQTSATGSDLHSVHFVNATTGWAVGYGGTILVTRNGGADWQAQMSGTTRSLNSVHFVNTTTGWAVGWDGTILATSNGGATWQAQTSETLSHLCSVHFVNTTTGGAVGWDGTILATSNGGQAWKTQLSGTSVLLSAVYFTNISVGWAIGGEGTVLATFDGGETWVPQTRGSSINLDSGNVFKDGTTLLPYSRSFAPWYYLTWLFIAPLFISCLQAARAN